MTMTSLLKDHYLCSLMILVLSLCWCGLLPRNRNILLGTGMVMAALMCSIVPARLGDQSLYLILNILFYASLILTSWGWCKEDRSLRQVLRSCIGFYVLGASIYLGVRLHQEHAAMALGCIALSPPAGVYLMRLAWDEKKHTAW